MNGKTIFGLLAGLMLVFVLAGPLAAAEQTFDVTIPGCTEWGPFGRIRSILNGVDGIIGVAIAAEHTIRVTFDGLKTDQEKITNALLQGGVTIPGKPEPTTKTPFSYK